MLLRLLGRTVRNWIKKITTGNFDLQDEDRCGRPVTTDSDVMKTVLAGNLLCSAYGIAEDTNISKTTVDKDLIKMG